jgi:hypothetical protein
MKSDAQTDYEKGYADGRNWQRYAEGHPDESANPFFPLNPSKASDASKAYRLGARCGIGDEKYKRKRVRTPFMH